MVVVFATIVALSVMVSPVWSATYFTSTSGSDGNSCATAQNGGNNPANAKRNIAGANGGISCVFPGDTLFIRGGTYVEAIIPPGNTWMRSGTDDNNRTTFAGYQNEVVILQPSGGAAVLSLQQTGNYSWMTFEKLIFDGINTTGVANIAGDTHHLRFRNVELKNSHFDGNSHGFGGSGGHHHEFLSIYIHDVTGYGAYFSGADSVWDHVTITDNGGYGLHFYDKASHIDNTIVRNSVIARNGFNNQFGGGGIVLFHGDNQQVYNNLIYGNFEGIGIRSSCNSCRVFNNTIYGNQFRAVQILGETFDYEYPPGSGIFREIRPPTNVYLQNNIMANNGSTIEYTNGTIAAQDHNLCQGTNQNLCDITGNPSFVNAGGGDFHLNGDSAARNRIPSSGGQCAVSIDFAGTTRPQTPTGGSSTPCDIGAYEYNEGGIPPPDPTGNPIYVSQASGNDANDCIAAESQSTPKLTLTSAICDCMHTVPGKRLIVKTGTYVEKIDTGVCALMGGNGPSFTNATTIETFGTDAVTIRLPATDYLVLFLQNGANDKYLLFKGSSANKLVFDGNNVVGSNGIGCWPGGHHIRFEQVEVKNTVGGNEAFYNQGCNNVEIVDSYIHHAGTAGVAMAGTTTDNLIQRTAIYNNGTKGINVIGTSTTNLTVRESVLHHNVDGIFLGTSTNFTLVNSILQENTGVGIQIATGAGSPKLQNNTIYANTGVGVQCDVGATGVQVTNVMSYGNGTNLLNNCSMTQLTNRTGTSDPFFVNAPTDLRLTPNQSDGIDTGTNIPALTIDYAGLARQQGQQDIGAYETTQTSGGGGGDVTLQPCNVRQASMLF